VRHAERFLLEASEQAPRLRLTARWFGPAIQEASRRGDRPRMDRSRNRSASSTESKVPMGAVNSDSTTVGEGRQHQSTAG